ncbi:hypothetical protein SDC9_150351 [bioreactor metagenome]|uniref:Uncharacterized protein n=1 Tax=bioreactor metagenome TaxID=1076179 RepID=A0A645EM84_9ZZZZ
MVSADQRTLVDRVQVEGAGHPGASDFEQVGKTFGDHQHDPAAAALDDGVQSDRHAVGDRRDGIAGADLGEQRPHALFDGLRRVGRGTGHFVAKQRRPAVRYRDEVGERAADVDADPVRDHQVSSFRSSQCSGFAGAGPGHHGRFRMRG